MDKSIKQEKQKMDLFRMQARRIEVVILVFLSYARSPVMCCALVECKFEPRPYFNAV